MRERNEDALIKKYFSYLFEDYGFTITKMEYFEQFNNWAAVLSTEKCRLCFEEDRGSVTASVGPISNLENPNIERWFGLTVVTAYLNQGVFTWDYSPMGDLEPQLKRLSGILHPYMDQICELFSPAVFAKHKDAMHNLWDKKYGRYLKRS